MWNDNELHIFTEMVYLVISHYAGFSSTTILFPYLLFCYEYLNKPSENETLSLAMLLGYCGWKLLFSKYFSQSGKSPQFDSEIWYKLFISANVWTHATFLYCIWKAERDKSRQTDVYLPYTGCFPDAIIGQGWIRPKPGAENSIWVPHTNARGFLGERPAGSWNWK